MDKITVSRNSWMFKLAKFGGFKTGYYNRPNSCDYISSLVMGIIASFIVLFVSIGAIFVLIVKLFSLGLPQEASNFINSMNLMMSIFWVFGMFAWIVGILFVIAVSLIWLMEDVLSKIFKRIFKSISNISNSRPITHISDYMSGICKPVEIID